jgi:hypothetical protein
MAEPNPRPDTRSPNPDTRHLLSPGTAAVSLDGVVTLAGADLAFAGLGDRCTPRIHASEHTVTLTPGTSRVIRHHCGTSSLDLAAELNAIGIDPRKLLTHPPVLVRVTDGERRSLELRFGPKALKNKAKKNKRA